MDIHVFMSLCKHLYVSSYLLEVVVVALLINTILNLISYLYRWLLQLEIVLTLVFHLI